MSDYREALRARLRVEEGERLTAYRDSRGVLTLGVGHNLEDPIRPEAAALILEHDIDDAERDARALVPTFDELTPARQGVVVDMAFNLGGIRLAEFHRFLAALSARDWMHAADEMLDSEWAQQVGDRAHRLADLMRHDNPDKENA